MQVGESFCLNGILSRIDVNSKYLMLYDIPCCIEIPVNICYNTDRKPCKASLYGFRRIVLMRICLIDGFVKTPLQTSIFTYGIIQAESLAKQVFTAFAVLC